LLFERLADDAPHTQQEPRPFRSYDLDGLQVSLQREVERLLNTRLGPRPDPAVARRTVIGYGVADHVLDNPTSTRDQDQICSDVAEAIHWFEPRLLNVEVTPLEADPRAQSLTLAIDGEVVLSGQRLSLRFPVVIGGGGEPA